MKYIKTHFHSAQNIGAEIIPQFAFRVLPEDIARGFGGAVSLIGEASDEDVAMFSMIDPKSSFSMMVKDVMIIGASQHSRCSTEVMVTSAQIINQVLYITHQAPLQFGFVNGQEAFCAVDGHLVFGNVTITSNTTLTMPAPGMANTVANTSGGQFLHFTGLHTGASWIGHLQRRYGGGMRFVGNVSQHGANVSEVAKRLPEIKRAIALKRPQIALFEGGWGNSINQDASWAALMEKGLNNLAQIAPMVPTVVITTLPPIAPGGSPSAIAIDNFNRFNQYVMSGELQKRFPNVVVVDCTTALIDKSRTDAGSIANIHSDSLHWTPKGAYMLANNCYGPVLDAFIPKLPLSRGGASHVWDNGNRQLFDGLTTNGGSTPVVAGITITGTLDATMAIAKAGGGAVTVAFSKTQLANGLYKQVAAISGMGGTTVMTLSVPGASGALLKDRLVPGHTYRLVMRVGLSGITGTIKGVSVLAVGTLTGHPGTGQKLLWAGRTQYGYVEGDASVFPQVDAEAASDYMSVDFTIPAGVTVADFSPAVVIASGASSSGITVEIEDILLEDLSAP